MDTTTTSILVSGLAAAMVTFGFVVRHLVATNGRIVDQFMNHISNHDRDVSSALQQLADALGTLHEAQRADHAALEQAVGRLVDAMMRTALK